MVVEVTSREFRDKQAAMFDLADKGTQVIVRRRRKMSYMLMPVRENDVEKELSPELKAVIDRGLENIAMGRTHRYTTMANLNKRLGL